MDGLQFIMENPINPWMIWGDISPYFWINTHVYFFLPSAPRAHLCMDFSKVVCDLVEEFGLQALTPCTNTWRSGAICKRFAGGKNKGGGFVKGGGVLK